MVVLNKIENIFKGFSVDDIDRNCTKLNLDILIKVILGGCVLILISTFFSDGISYRTLSLTLSAMALLSITLVLYNKKLYATSSILTALFILGIINYSVFLADGIHDLAMVLLPIGILLISMFLNSKYYLFVTTVNVLYIAWLGWSEYTGTIVNRLSDHTDEIDIVVAPVAYGLVAFITRYITHTLRSSFKEILVTEENYKTLFNSSVLSIFIHDVHSGAIIDLNETACDLLKLPRELILHKTPDAFSANDSDFTKEKLKKYFQQAIDDTVSEFEWLLKDGEGNVSWINVNFKKISTNNNPVIMALIQNIDARKNNEYELEQYRVNLEEIVDTKKTELLSTQEELVEQAHKAGMAEIATGALHNVGNILNSVFVSAETIETEILNGDLLKLQKVNKLITAHKGNLAEFITGTKGDKLIEYLKELEILYSLKSQNLDTQLKRMKDKTIATVEVINSQQEYAKQIYLVEFEGVEKIIDNVLSIVNGSLEKHNINVLCRYSKTPSINIQKSKLIHVLINLLNNAIDSLKTFSVSKREIIISTKDNVESVFITILDNGQGISKQSLTKVFNHGFTTKVDGHGFGLHSCANYAQEMGGDLFVESEGVGKGALFTITLPKNT